MTRSSPTLLSRLNSDPALALILAAALTLFMLLPAYTFLTGYDWFSMQRFWKIHYHDALLKLQVPLWNPYIALGRPFLADIETATLYPPNLIYILGANLGFVCSITLHLAWLLLGGVRLFRALGASRWAAWFGSIGFALSAPLLARLQSGQAQVFCTLCWLPWIFLATQHVFENPTKRAAALLALTLALAFLAGSPPFFWVMSVGVGLFVGLRLIGSWREPKLIAKLAMLTCAGGLAAGLVAVQALPFLELVGQGNRSLGATGFSSMGALDGLNWLSLLMPKLPSAHFYWEFNLYAGLPFLLMAVTGLWWWRRREFAIWLALAATGALLAVGPLTPFFHWAMHFPGMHAWRYPSRYAILTDFAFAVLAALALTKIAGYLRARFPRNLSALALLAGIVLFIETTDTLRAFWLRAPLTSSGARSSADAEFPALLQQRQLFDSSGTPPRIVYPYLAARENSGMIHGFSAITAVTNPWLGRVWDYICVATAMPPPTFDFTHTPKAANTAPEKFTAANLVARWDDAAQTLQPIAQPDPRVYLAPLATAVATSHDAAVKMAAGHPFHQNALVESPALAAKYHAPAAANVTQARITHFSNPRIELEYTTDHPAILVLAEPWYPGWRAKVAGADTEVFPVNSWMRGIEVSPGQHRVTFEFVPTSLWIGTGITIVAFLVWLWMWRQPPHSKPAGTQR